MEKFLYKAKKDGTTIKGVIEAKDQKEAVKILQEQNLFIISITAQKQSSSLLPVFTNRVSLSELVQFTRQLSSMITAGLTLTEALSVLEEQTEKETMKKVLNEVLTDIEGGSSFSNALGKHPDVFKTVYVAMIRAAEEGGLLDKILARLADNLEKEKALKGKLVGALIYPLIIIISMLGVGMVMMFFVIPTIKGLYKDLGVTLPLPTQIILAVSDFMTHGWFLIVGLLILSLFIFSSYSRSQLGKRQLDGLTLKIFVFGKLRKLLILTEMSRTLGLLVGAGTPIIEALNITGETTGSIWYKDSLADVAKKVEKGISLGEALGEDTRFPPILTQMGKVGEATGKLDETLLKVSTYFETEAEQSIKTLTTALEPLIMIILGVGVAFLMIAVILPLYSLTTAFK